MKSSESDRIAASRCLLHVLPIQVSPTSSFCCITVSGYDDLFSLDEMLSSTGLAFKQLFQICAKLGASHEIEEKVDCTVEDVEPLCHHARPSIDLPHAFRTLPVNVGEGKVLGIPGNGEAEESEAYYHCHHCELILSLTLNVVLVASDGHPCVINSGHVLIAFAGPGSC